MNSDEAELRSFISQQIEGNFALSVIAVDYVGVGDPKDGFDVLLIHPSDEKREQYIDGLRDNYFARGLPSKLVKEGEASTFRLLELSGARPEPLGSISPGFWASGTSLRKTIPVDYKRSSESIDRDENWDSWNSCVKSAYPSCTLVLFAKYLSPGSADTNAVFIYCAHSDENLAADVRLDPTKDPGKALLKNCVEGFLIRISNDFVLPKHLERITRHALNSAIGSIALRNYAHHIGAHIKLRTTPQEIKSRLTALYENVPIQQDDVVHWMDTMKERLDLYEVHRNEFLSDVRLPPRNVKFLQDVLLPFCENTLILDNLARSEGLGYQTASASKMRKQNQLRLHYFHWNKDELGNLNGGEVVTEYPELRCVDVEDECPGTITYPTFFPYLIRHVNYDPQNPNRNTLTEGLNRRVFKFHKDGRHFADYNVCLVNEHSVYSELENFIRNSAKHNAPHLTKHPKLDVEVHVHDVTDDPGFYTCTFFDNVSAVRIDRLKAILKGKQAPLLTDGQPSRLNLGMADMKISAHLLQSPDEFNEEGLNAALSIVRKPTTVNASTRFEHLFLKEDTVVFSTEPEPQDRLTTATQVVDEKPIPFGYQLKLAKAKKVVWIGPVELQKEGALALQKEGIFHYLNWAEYIQSLSMSLAAFEIAVLEPTAWAEVVGRNGEDLRNNLMRLPFRVLVNDGHCAVDLVVSRRVVARKVGLDLNATPDTVYSKLLEAWVDAKHALSNDQKLHLRAVFLEQGVSTPPPPLQTETLDAWVCYWDGKTARWPAGHTRGVGVEVVRNAGRVATLDHHGTLSAVGLLTVNGERPLDQFIADWNRLRNAYFFEDKGNRDLEILMRLLKGSKLVPNEIADLLDRFLTRVVIVDERLALLSVEPLLSNDVKVSPHSTWGLYAAANVFVVTSLTIKRSGTHAESTEYRFINDEQATALSMIVDPLAQTVQFSPVPGRDQNGDAHFDSEVASMKHDITSDADILIIHRTHWRNLDKDSRSVLHSRFPDIVITSGAGQPEELGANKFIPFATLRSFVGQRSISKLGLAASLYGLFTPPPNTKSNG